MNRATNQDLFSRHQRYIYADDLTRQIWQVWYRAVISPHNFRTGDGCHAESHIDDEGESREYHQWQYDMRLVLKQLQRNQPLLLRCKEA